MKATILIGTYTGSRAGPAGPSRGIYSAEFDGATGAIGSPRLWAELANPSFLALHPSLPHAYAVGEGGKSGAVTVLRLQPSGPAVEATVSSCGSGPCHVAVAPGGDFLAVSNYGSGDAGIYGLREGLPAGEPSSFHFEGRGPNEKRQEAPHAHSAVFDPGGKAVRFMDLGTDRLWGFSLDKATGKAIPLAPPFTVMKPGSGPRHAAFHPNGRWLYVINELDNTVTALSLTNGALEVFQISGSLPEDAPDPAHNYCAEVRVSPDGAFLYGTNRGHDSIAVWRISPSDGTLSPVQHAPCGGNHPRHFTISPDGHWLLCANMNSHNIVVFRRDAGKGTLERVSETPAPCPVCLVFTR
jgi:6-phosphogluconolactonase